MNVASAEIYNVDGSPLSDIIKNHVNIFNNASDSVDFLEKFTTSYEEVASNKKDSTYYSISLLRIRYSLGNSSNSAIDAIAKLEDGLVMVYSDEGDFFKLHTVNISSGGKWHEVRSYNLGHEEL